MIAWFFWIGRYACIAGLGIVKKNEKPFAVGQVADLPSTAPKGRVSDLPHERRRPTAVSRWAFLRVLEAALLGGVGG